MELNINSLAEQTQAQVTLTM